VSAKLKWLCDSQPPLADMELPNGMKIRHYNKIETDWLFREIFEDATYGKLEADDGATVDLKFHPGMTVVDVGGNIGMFALYALHRCGGEAEVHSFEPMPAIFDVLEENCKRANANALGALTVSKKTKLVPHKVACGTEAGTLHFEFHPRMSLWSTNDAAFDADRRAKMGEEIAIMVDQMVPSYLCCFRPLASFLAHQLLELFQQVDKVEARVVRLSDELEASGVGKSSKSRIGLLKVDVEGAELQVLSGIDAADWARVDQVAMELEGVPQRDEAARILRSHGLTPHWAPAIKMKGAKEHRVWNLLAVRK
jgi:FkbM family methyltransferase